MPGSRWHRVWHHCARGVPRPAGANEFVSHERPAPHLLDRIHDMTRTSAAAITLPGSLGTLTELVAAWNLAFVARFSGTAPKPLITVGEQWATLVDHLASTLDADRALVLTVATVDDAVRWCGNSSPRQKPPASSPQPPGRSGQSCLPGRGPHPRPLRNVGPLPAAVPERSRWRLGPIRLVPGAWSLVPIPKPPAKTADNWGMTASRDQSRVSRPLGLPCSASRNRPMSAAPRYG